MSGRRPSRSARKFQQVGDAAALGGAAHVGNLVHALDVHAAQVREEHQVVVRARGEEMLDEVAVLGLSRLRAWLMPMTPLPPRRWAR
jgi:hypothetical protein